MYYNIFRFSSCSDHGRILSILLQIYKSDSIDRTFSIFEFLRYKSRINHRLCTVLYFHNQHNDPYILRKCDFLESDSNLQDN